MKLRISVLLAMTLAAFAQTPRRGNDPAAVELFRDRGLGLFIHWSVDGPLGGVISHSLVGASPDYVELFFRILPGQFNPDRLQPEKSPAPPKLAGFDSVMSNDKHRHRVGIWNGSMT